MQKLKDFLLSLHHYQVYAIFLLTLLVSLLGRRMYDDAQIKAQLQEEFFSDEGEEIFAVQGDVCNEGSYVGPNCGWDCD